MKTIAEWPGERTGSMVEGDRMLMSVEMVRLLAEDVDQVLVEVVEIRQFKDGTKLLMLKRADR